MHRILYLILLLLLGHTLAHAQSEPIVVSGQVRCGTEAVEGGIVSLLQPSDSSIVAYAMTDESGHYSLQARIGPGEVLIRVAGFNVKRKTVRIKAQSQTLNFNVERESVMLREAVVKAQKLWGSRDTLNYLVSAYTRGHDRTIGDVLRQLPGITIEDNGVIKYQGTPINRFYIENLDMLQGRYNLATEGIKAEDVATVQVLENHEHVRALQDQTPDESAAINLKLKNRAKGVWAKSADLGMGGYADGILWQANVQAMRFGRGGQHMLRYSGDNLGRSLDAATVHYGSASGSTQRMLGIVGHGSSPVGNGWFGYRHAVNLNNLSKLSDSVTVNYNFNYSHNLSRGNSFSQTTYLLPDESSLLLTEDISDRTHTNTADLQLTYEKNGRLRFLNNRLSVFGRWDEGRGSIRQSQADGEQGIGQALHRRSLGLTNHTRMVRRTEKGGGFEWTSVNALSSSPQTLAIGGDMTARQSLDVHTVSTANSIELLRNIRAHRWPLAVSGHLNAAYTALNSILTHPDVETATSDGRLHHLRAQADVGPVLRYAKGPLQSSLRVPVALAYTCLDNAPVDGEKTDADRIRLYLQPSFSLLWKATDRFTVNASADYSASETTWSQLLTATVMQNYRSLSRYRAALNDHYVASARLKMEYKDLFNGFFANLEGGWKRSWSDVAYGSTLDDQAHTVIEAVPMPNHANRYMVGAYGRKDIDWHTMQMELSASCTMGRTELLRQSVLTDYHTKGYTVRGTLSFDLFRGCRLDYSATWQHSRYSSSGVQSSSSSEWDQRARLTLQILPSRLLLNVNASHTHNSRLASSRKDYVFLGSGLQFKMNKRVELSLDGDNLTNLRTYITRSLGNMEEYYTEYHLRPLSVLLSARIRF